MYTIYSKKNCVWCDRAKKLLEDTDILFHELKVEDEVNKQALLVRFEELGLGKPKTVPQIFDDEGNHIGGYTDLAEKFLEV